MFSRFAAVFLGMILVVALVFDLLFKPDALLMREREEESRLRESEELKTKGASRTHVGPSLVGIICESLDEDLPLTHLLVSVPTKIQLPPCFLDIFFNHSPPFRTSS